VQPWAFFKMNLQFYTEKLAHSEEYKKFMKKHKDAYFYSGFFSVDKEGKDNQVHLDFFILNSEEVFSFRVDGQEIVLSPITIYDEKVPEKISNKLDVDFGFYENLILKEIENQKIKNKIQKFLFSLQRLENKDYLIVTCFLSNFGLVKMHICLEDNKISHFEKKSIFDMVSVFKKK